jgi:hypothetical protein
MTSRKTGRTGLVLLAATTLVVAACGGKKYDTPMPPAANSAPSVSAITNRTSSQDTTIGPIEFGIADRESDASSLIVSAVADGTGIVDTDGVTLAGSGAVRSITLTPLEAATGAVNVTVTVADPQGAATSRSFRVTVNARSASARNALLTTYAKSAADEATAISGFTFVQDADDSAIFAPLIGAGAE